MGLLKTILKAFGAILLLLILTIIGVVMWASTNVSSRMQRKFNFPPLNITENVKTADVELGRKIVRIRNGCTDCHGADLGGKTFISDPAMGTFSGANITPQGIGSKSDEDVARAIYYGVRSDGSSLTFMPSQEFHQLALEDVAAVVAYLRTVPAVMRPNTAIEIGPIAKLLGASGKMPLLIPAELIPANTPPTTKPPEGNTPGFGKYLVDSGCTGCHGRDLKGGPIPGGNPSWPPAANLVATSHSTWKEADFINTIRTGKTPDGRMLRDPMRGVAENARQGGDDDLKAIWSYLVTLKD